MDGMSTSSLDHGRTNLGLGLVGLLCSVPNRNDPDHLSLESIEKTIRDNNDLSKRKIWKLGELASRVWKPVQPEQSFFGFASKLDRGPGLVFAYVVDRREELGPRGWSEADRH